MNVRKAEFFDTQAEAEWASAEYTTEELRKISRMLDLTGVGHGMKILEPGCGTGRLTRILADRVGPKGFVLAMDISTRMVEACLRNVAVEAHVEVLRAAVEDYPLVHQEFDAIVCHQVYPHFDAKRGALRIFAKILRPLGALALFHFISSSRINNAHLKAHPAVMNDLMPSEKIMRDMLAFTGFEIDLLEDDENGYLLIAHIAR